MPKKRSYLQTKAELFAVRLVLGAIGLFPLARSMKIGATFAKLTSKLFKRLHFVGHRNLELALPELSKEKHEEILEGCFESLGRQLGLVSHFPHLTPEQLRTLVDVEGIEFIEQAQADGRGAILFSAHFGGWEASNLVFSAHGFDWNVLVRRIDNPLVENYIERLRTRFGAQTIDKKASARTMLRVLQAGKLLGIVADLNVQEQEGVFVDFFGIPASTTTGLARLALRTEARVMPIFFVWQEKQQKYLLKIEPPLEIRRTGDETEDVRLLTQLVTAKIEEYVRLYPEQWMWIHKRWNTRPPGQPDLYAKDLEIQNPKPKVQSQTKFESQT